MMRFLPDARDATSIRLTDVFTLGVVLGVLPLAGDPARRQGTRTVWT